MSRTPILPFFLCFCLLLSVLPVLSDIDTQYSEKIENAVKWLKAGYNSSIGLIVENHVGSSDPSRENNYWLFSDNFMAYLVLLKYDKALAHDILAKIHYYGYFQNYKHAAYARGNNIKMPPYYALQTSGYPPCYFLVDNVTGSEIWVEYYTNATGQILDYEDCISWLFPKALTLYWQGKIQEAKNTYQKALNDYWDGVGFLPKEYGAYVTYKLGAALYTGLVLYPYDWQIPKALSDKFTYWKALIWQEQKEDGDISTHYDASFTPDSNTETTCFSLLYTTVQTVETKAPLETYASIAMLGVILAAIMKLWRKIDA